MIIRRSSNSNNGKGKSKVLQYTLFLLFFFMLIIIQSKFSKDNLMLIITLLTCIDANNDTFNVSYVTRTNTKWIAHKFNAYRINHLLVLTFYWQLVFIIKERFIVYYGNDVWFRW